MQSNCFTHVKWHSRLFPTLRTLKSGQRSVWETAVFHLFHLSVNQLILCAEAPWPLHRMTLLSIANQCTTGRRKTAADEERREEKTEQRESDAQKRAGEQAKQREREREREKECRMFTWYLVPRQNSSDAHIWIVTPLCLLLCLKSQWMTGQFGHTYFEWLLRKFVCTVKYEMWYLC